MQRYKSILICIILVILLTSCFNEENKANENPKSSLNSMIVSDSSEENFEAGFSFNSSLNVFYSNNNSSPLENKIDVKGNELLSLKLLTNVSPDKSLDNMNITMRIWVMVDGSPIEFSIGDDDKYENTKDISVEASLDQFTEINFNISNEVKLITIICVYFPEEIPERGLGAYSGEISYTITNTAYSEGSSLLNLPSDYYVDVPHREENYGLDIGALTVKENSNKVVELHFYEDIMLTGENKNLYVKFNSGNKKEIPYYIIVLCDGTMIDIFDKNYSYKVDCLKGIRTYQYCIPSSGLHTFQVIAIPADIGEDLSTYSTHKVRVQIS